ncbi:hypothetical protein GCM10027168_25910 [Streptomyces capparidis]
MDSPAERRPAGPDRGDPRTALERAALELVTERGPHGFTLTEAGRRAGVGGAAPGEHFPDRDALLAALAAKGYREQLARFVEALRAGGDPAEQLAAFAAAHVRFAAEEPALFDVTFNAGLDASHHPELAAARDALATALVPVVSRLATDPAAAFDLLLRITAAGHGLAAFLRQGLSGMTGPPPPGTETGAGPAAPREDG